MRQLKPSGDGGFDGNYSQLDNISIVRLRVYNLILKKMEQKAFFEEYGYLSFDNVLSLRELEKYRQLYEDFLNGTIDTENHRSDLSGKGKEKEQITQIMRPSLLMEGLQEMSLHQKTIKIAQDLLGEDMALDFDMLIDKAPFTNTLTPWHQDEAYWINMPDKRAVSCWVALDDAFKENGCMWYIPGSHKLPLRPHWQTGKGGALACDAKEVEATAVALKAGSCTFHHGRTIHYSRGNSTKKRRRAFILNFRPVEMIEFERKRGYDHLGKRSLKNSSTIKNKHLNV